jgi:hypothetical protein
LKNSNVSRSDLTLALRTELRRSPRCSELLLELLQAEAEHYQNTAATALEDRDIRRAQGGFAAVTSLMKKLQAEANTAP